MSVYLINDVKIHEYHLIVKYCLYNSLVENIIFRTSITMEMWWLFHFFGLLLKKHKWFRSCISFFFRKWLGLQKPVSVNQDTPLGGGLVRVMLLYWLLHSSSPSLTIINLLVTNSNGHQLGSVPIGIATNWLDNQLI